MPELKVFHITRTIILTSILFLLVFLGLEFFLSLYFTGYASDILEKDRKNELIHSWKNYFDQRKSVLVTTLDGYANWSFLSENILKGNDSIIEDTFCDYIETLQKNYLLDYMWISGRDRKPVFSFFDHFTSKNDLQKISVLHNKEVEDHLYQEMQKSFEEEKKKSEGSPGIQSRVWCSLVQLNQEIFLTAYSFIADDNGKPVSPEAIMFVGVRMSKILELSSRVIPAKFKMQTKAPSPDGYLTIIENGFFPDEKFYFSLIPNYSMEEIIKDTIFWMMMVQIILIFVLILFIFPIWVRFYTRQLQKIIDEQTMKLTNSNEEQSKLIKHLQEALASIRTLEGLIPICASCKKVRNDNGYWEQVEEYIHVHTTANFSHGICPECIKKLYPGLAEKREKHQKEQLEHKNMESAEKKSDPPSPS